MNYSYRRQGADSRTISDYFKIKVTFKVAILKSKTTPAFKLNI